MAAARRVLFGVLLLGIAAAPAGALVVGTAGSCTAGSFTEASLDTALAAAGTITFDCGGGPVTITLTTTKTITRATTIDGGNVITISGGGT